MSEQRVRLAFTTLPTRQQVSAAATDSGWLWWDKIEPREGNPLEVIWMTRDMQNRIHFIEDRNIGAVYFSFIGPDAERLAEEARHALPLYGLEETLQMLDGEPTQEDELQAACSLAVLGPGECTEGPLRALERLLRSPHPNVRHLALLSASYRGWRELLPTVRTLAAEDPDEPVQDRAQRLVEALEKDA